MSDDVGVQRFKFSSRKAWSWLKLLAKYNGEEYAELAIDVPVDDVASLKMYRLKFKLADSLKHVNITRVLMLKKLQHIVFIVNDKYGFILTPEKIEGWQVPSLSLLDGYYPYPHGYSRHKDHMAELNYQFQTWKRNLVWSEL